MLNTLHRPPRRSLYLILLALLLSPVLLFAGLGGMQLPVETCRSNQDPRYTLAALPARILARQVKAIYGSPGISIAAALNGKTIWSESYGYANIDGRIPACPSTHFRVGSVSKPLTAGAALRLYDQGRLNLDAPVQQYVPTFPQKGAPITSRMLLGHLSGIRHYQSSEEITTTRHYDSLADALDLFADDPLLAHPGTAYKYTSFGYNLLGVVVEGAQGEPFPQAMRSLVYQPLGMDHTSVDDVTQADPQLAVSYQDNLEGITKAPFVDDSFKYPSGGMVSTAEDLVQFAAGLMSGSLIKPETLELMLTPQCPQCPKLSRREAGYGLGLSVSRDWWGRRLAYHDGHATGGSAILWMYPDQKLALAITMNTGTRNSIELKGMALHVTLAWIAQLFLTAHWATANQVGLAVFPPALVVFFSLFRFRMANAGKV